MAHNYHTQNNYNPYPQHGAHQQQPNGQQNQNSSQYGSSEGLQRFSFPATESYQFAPRSAYSTATHEPQYGQPTATQSHMRQSSGGTHQVGQGQPHTGNSYNGASQQSVQRRPQFPQQPAQQKPASYYIKDSAMGSSTYRNPTPQQMPLRATQTSSPAGYQSSVRAPPPPTSASSPIPNIYQNGRQNGSEQLPQTVDPSQFHDSFLESERRKAVTAANEEAARKEAEEKSRKHREERERIGEAKRLVEEQRQREEAQKAAAEQSQASSSVNGPTAASLEAEMRAMFTKLREYNKKDPELLSKLWAQERENHLSSQSANNHQTPKPQPAQSPPTQYSEQTKPKATNKDTPGKKKGRPKNNAQSSIPSQPVFQAKATPAVDHLAKLKPAPAPQSNTQPAIASTSMSQSLPTGPKAQQQKRLEPLQTPVLGSGQSKGSASSMWPADKKVLLSAAASNLVQSMPETRGRTLIPSDVAAMLDKNPSYVELCDSIEKLGFKLNRAAFAKGLLAVVPDNNAKLSQASPIARPAASASPAPLAPGSGNAVNALTAQANFPKSNNVPSGSVQSENSQAPVKIIVSGKVLGPVHPPSKEDASRKRTFADLVDLTQLSDEDPSPNWTDAEMQHPNAQNGAPSVIPQQPAQVAPMSMQDTAAKRLLDSHPLRIQGAVKPLDRHRAIRRSKYNPKTIARDVLLACGRHPDMQPLNTHLDKMKGQPLKLPDDSDLDTLRWDLIDAGGLPAGCGMPNDADLVEEDDGFADDESQAGSESEVEVTRRASAAGNAGGTATAIMSTPMHAPNPTSIKKRTEPSTRTPNTRTRQHAPTPQSGTPSTYTELRQQAEHSGAPARRGRPVGWRKWMQRSPSSSASKQTPKSAKQPPASPPEPNYPEFKCLWEGCERSLHNLDTLRHHVFKIHDKPETDGQRTCHWDDCGRIEIVRDEQRTTTRKIRNALPDRKQWRSHIENAHLSDVAWRQGDGPAAGLAQHPESASERSDAYLSDRDGRQVTPRVELPPTRGFTAVNTAAPRETAVSRAQEEVRAAEARRARLGVGIDHGGARSVDDAMRDTMQDDADSDTPAIEVLDGDDPMEF